MFFNILRENFIFRFSSREKNKFLIHYVTIYYDVQVSKKKFFKKNRLAEKSLCSRIFQNFVKRLTQNTKRHKKITQKYFL